MAPRGIKAAKRMGRFLTEAGLAPDLVISSTAVRARTTADLAVEAGNWACPVLETRQLYGTNVQGALEVVRSMGDEPTLESGRAERLMLVGHEPTWSSLASALVGGGRLAVVTAAAVVIDLAIERWADIGLDKGELRMLLPPRLLS